MRSTVAMRRIALAPLAALAVAGLASTSSASAAKTARPASGNLKFIFVKDVPEPNAFDTPMINGYNAAGKQLGVQTIFRGSPNANSFVPADEKTLLENAIAEHPSGLIVNFDNPTAEGPLVLKAEHEGIPVVFSSAGYGEAKKYGALTYIGSDETLAGQVCGQQLNKLGATHALMITLPSGFDPIVADRNNGFAKGFHGKITWLYLDSSVLSNSGQIEGAVAAKLTSNPSINGVCTAGNVLTPGELAAEKALGHRSKSIHWSTLDINAQILSAIKSGQLAFGLDQQQYLEGYWAVTVLDQYIRYGLRPVSSQMATGPVLVDRSNVGQVSRLSQQGVR